MTAIFMACHAQPPKSSFDPNTLGETPELVIETSAGDITVKLYQETPLHRNNFLKLASTGYFDGVIFHRVIENFMIQTGDPDSKNPEAGKMYGMGGPDYTVPAEIAPGLYHKRGALAAARNDNPDKASSGSQFYIVQGDVCPPELLEQLAEQGISFTPEQKETYTQTGGAPWLDGGYTVFGEATQGMEVVDKIAALQKDRHDRPLQDVFILRIYPVLSSRQ
ncbi:MAG: peptidylprolyl isomerase [Prevotellaceae bacterium]|nr:peptidylprolyl isomerase [Prevotellaceae bacterium]